MSIPLSGIAVRSVGFVLTRLLSDRVALGSREIPCLAIALPVIRLDGRPRGSSQRFIQTPCHHSTPSDQAQTWRDPH
jgi:hypothetical protein